ncbi:Riboflavin biosynthesis protein RibBA [Physocladia obscura]|uniref:Riboflavin biosynthesis protein RibBA n=1 Tax=Physocladia obscura TaxID=109957 RepID=A0AAD5T3M2_9FUNG|nr:Riboflavin biosynthesis protein RibBA [Physocladia obscura]
MSFGEKTTAAEVAAVFGSRIAGKHFVVTGGNSGLGKETARVLAASGAIVTLCCRSVAKAEEAKNEIIHETPNAEIRIVPLDLADLKSVKESAEILAKATPKINVLINNAGVMACPKALTQNGLEFQFQTNYLAPYYLTLLLLDALHESGTPADPSRVINVSSTANVLFGPDAGISFDDLAAKKSYNPWSRYGESKLAQIVSAADLQKRIAGKKNVAFVSVHPGNIPSSNLTQYIGLSSGLKMTTAIHFNKIGPSKILSQKSIPEGAATIVFCAVDPNIQFGKYYSDCDVTDIVHSLAFDESLAAKLTEISDKLIADANL